MKIDPGISCMTILDLADKRARDAKFVGGKAANLAAMIETGLPVPPGIVLVPDEGWTSYNTFYLQDTAVNRMVHNFSPLAVRSSAVGEDGKKASYAGQFRTYLWVRGGSEHLHRCVAAITDPSNHNRPSFLVSYADKIGGQSKKTALAKPCVIMQPMVHASRAVVAFSVDPVSGAKHEVIEVVKGCGELLVGGKTTPATWERQGNQHGEPKLVHVYGPEIDIPEPKRLLELVAECKDLFGCDVDVEAAHDDAQWWLVQARPVTAK